jgi:hypothetical protein
VRARLIIALLAVAGVVSLALGCGGGEERTAAPPPITRQTLAAMVPQIADFPAGVRGLPKGDTVIDRGTSRTRKQAHALLIQPTRARSSPASAGRAAIATL